MKRGCFILVAAMLAAGAAGFAQRQATLSPGA